MRIRRVLLLAAVLAVTACGGDDDANGGEPVDAARAAEENAALAVALTPIRSMSLVEVEYGEMAGQRASNPSLSAYARTVAADHRALIGALDSVAGLHDVTLNETRETQELANTVRMAHSGLDALTGPDFDLPYIRAEVESHRLLLDRIDQQLIPAARTEEVRTLLTDIRAMTDAHLARARQLLAERLGQSVEPARPRPPQPAAGQPAPQQPDSPRPAPPPPPDTIPSPGAAPR